MAVNFEFVLHRHILLHRLVVEMHERSYFGKLLLLHVMVLLLYELVVYYLLVLLELDVVLDNFDFVEYFHRLHLPLNVLVLLLYHLDYLDHMDYQKHM